MRIQVGLDLLDLVTIKCYATVYNVSIRRLRHVGAQARPSDMTGARTITCWKSLWTKRAGSPPLPPTLIMADSRKTITYRYIARSLEFPKKHTYISSVRSTVPSVPMTR